MNWIIIGVVCTAIITIVSGNGVRWCYYSGWAVNRQAPNNLRPRDIDPNLCTHLVFAFAGLDNSTTHLKPITDKDEQLYTEFNSLKTQNPELKTVLSLGGWNMGSRAFSDLVSSTQNMRQFAHNTVRYLRHFKFDGLDLDWEYPAARGSPQQDKDRYIHLLQILRDEFEHDPEIGRHGLDRLLLSAAVGLTESQITESYNITQMTKYLDLIILMTYDFHGEWEETVNAHSALYSDNDYDIDRFATYWSTEGADKSRLLIGIPFYGRKFTLANVSDHEPGANNTGGGDMPYYEICDLIEHHGVKPTLLTTERVPYLVFDDQWVSYDDVRSITEKTQYVTAHQFGGCAVWAIDQDDVTGVCGTGSYPLMNAIKRGLKNSGAVIG